MQFIRTNSFEKFINPDSDKHHQMELLFSLDPNVDSSFIFESPEYSPESPAGSIVSNQSSSIMDDLDSIFEDVITSPVASPQRPSSTFFAPTPPVQVEQQVSLDTIEPTIQQVYQDVVEPKHELDDDYRMEEEYVPVQNIQYFEQPTVSPLSEPRKRRLPAKERQQRKKQSNKESSRRYRQKVKNRQNDLLSSLEELTQKKRAIELDLAKTKAVNSFLVEQLRAKFGGAIWTLSLLSHFTSIN